MRPASGQEEKDAELRQSKDEAQADEEDDLDDLPF